MQVLNSLLFLFSERGPSNFTSGSNKKHVVVFLLEQLHAFFDVLVASSCCKRRAAEKKLGIFSCVLANNYSDVLQLILYEQAYEMK